MHCHGARYREGRLMMSIVRWDRSCSSSRNAYAIQSDPAMSLEAGEVHVGRASILRDH